MISGQVLLSTLTLLLFKGPSLFKGPTWHNRTYCLWFESCAGADDLVTSDRQRKTIMSKSIGSSREYARRKIGGNVALIDWNLYQTTTCTKL